MEVEPEQQQNGDNNDANMVAVDDDSDGEWHLARSFVSDDQGVRAACLLGGNGEVLVTGTQMGGLYFFDLATGALQADVTPPFQHDHAVTALLALPDLNPNSSASNAAGATTTTGAARTHYFASGCKDAVIRIFSYTTTTSPPASTSATTTDESMTDASAPAPAQAATLQLVTELKGHDKPVTSLALVGDSAGYLVSGSWDGTAAVWDLATKARVAVLEGHENAVCVAPWNAGADSDSVGVAAGSAGVAAQGTILKHTLRLWKVTPRTGERTLVDSIVQDHDGPIRDLCASNGSSDSTTMLATCSNDGTVKLRDAGTGKTQSTLTFLVEQEHPPMLLSCAFVGAGAAGGDGGGTLVAGAEDGHVVAWNLGTQAHPQLIRHPACVWMVFSAAGDGSEGDYFGTCCQDGRVYLFTRRPDVCASGESQRKFDEAVAAATSARQQGPSQDEIAKLPHWHNQQSIQGRSEGQVQLFQENGVAIAAQWSATAQTWIKVGQVTGSSGGGDDGGGGGSGVLDGVHYDHVLPIQVDQPGGGDGGGGGGVANLQIGYNTGENPFVAAQRFIDDHVLPQHHLSDIADYITQRVGSSNITLGGDQSAGTSAAGGGAPSAAAASGVPITSYQYVPAKAYKTFDLKASAAAETFGKMKTKIQGFGKLSEAQLQQVDSLMKSLTTAAPGAVSDSDLNVLSEMLDSLPLTECFPALDLARLAILRSASPEQETFWKAFVTKALALCQQAGAEKVEGPAAVAIPMLTLRLRANAFAAASSGQQAVAANSLMDILSCAKAHVRSSNKNVRLSVATVLYNVSLYLYSNKDNGAGGAQAGDAVVEVAVDVVSDIFTSRVYNESEAVLRALVSLGTLVLSSAAAKKAANAHYMASKVEPAASPFGQDVKAAAKEVYSLLQ